MTHCDKCFAEEETVEATSHCPTCNSNFCEQHIALHNSSNKTKSHAPLVESLKGKSAIPFSGEFKLVEKLGDHEDFQLDFNAPSHVVVCEKNKLIFVADGENFVYAFDSITRDYKYRFTYTGGDMRSMAIDPNDDSLVIAMYHYGCDRLTKISMDGKITRWTVVTQDKAHNIIVDPSDSKIYFLKDCYTNPVVHIFNGNDGSIAGKTAVNLDGEGLVERASCIAFDLEGNLVVANNYRRELTTMTKKGKILSTKRYEGESISYITSICFEKTGKMYVGTTHPDYSEVETWSSEGNSRFTGQDLPEKKIQSSHIHVALNSLVGELLVCSKWNKAVYVFK